MNGLDSFGQMVAMAEIGTPGEKLALPVPADEATDDRHEEPAEMGQLMLF